MLALRSLHSAGAHAVAARREKRTAPGRTSLTKDLQG